MFAHMRAQHLPDTLMRALAQQVFVKLAHHGAEPVGIVQLPLRAGLSGAAQGIGPLAGDLAREDIDILADAGQGMRRAAAHRLDLGGIREERGDIAAPLVAMRAQDRKRIGMPTVLKLPGCGQIDRLWRR